MDDTVSGFEALLQQTDQLTAKMDSGSELPRVERNLHQIKEAAQRMAMISSRSAQEAADIKAALLLGSKGYNIQKMSKRLEGLSSTQTFEPIEPIGDTDIQGFLKNERENALLAVIEQTKKNTQDEMQQRHWECLENEWEREKQKILNGLTALGQESVDLSQTGTILSSDSVMIHGRSTMDHVEMAYARQVYIYNDHILQGGIIPNAVDLLSEAARSFDDKNISEVWSMVSYMSSVATVHSQSSSAAGRASQVMQQALVSQALEYLENSYKKHIESTVYSNLQEAYLGGIPGTLRLVASFLNVRLSAGGAHNYEFQDGLVADQPVWAMVYYCLRCGDLQAALEVTQSAQNLGEFPQHLMEYVKSEERRLTDNSETKLRLQYRRSVRNCSDPFKRAVYCIIGRCDAKDDHSVVADKIDDYLWIKLNQLSSTVEDDHDSLSLPELQKMMVETYGEVHFNAYQQPYLYFQVLFLTGQFEAAIEFLSRVERLRTHAVHIAIALYESGLLLVSSTIQAQILAQEDCDPAGIKRINFARLIMMYTRKFECTDPREALLYFYFLRNQKTHSGDSVFVSCVSELVLETREFDMLLGQLGKDGSRKPGAIDKFHADTQKIIEYVASDTEKRGLFEDAVKLYDLAKKYNKVLELLNKLLTPVLSQQSAPQSNRSRIFSLAVAVAHRYRSNSLATNEYYSTTFYMLLDLVTFFDLYHAGKHEQAHQVMQDLKILPLTRETVDQKVKAFKNFSDEIRRCLPDILLAMMNIIHSQHKNAKASHTDDSTTRMQNPASKQSYLTYLSNQAQALITFAGMIPYRMPGDINSRLVKIGVLLN